ncbi:MAG: peptidase [Myxococcales bacterium]|nr:peptidase [Myxococcales bacterium]
MTALSLVAASWVALLAPKAALSTLAEQSGFTKTGRYEEVVRLCREFPRAYPKVKCATFGQTPERRPMLAFTVGAKGKPTLVVQGGIHAGEIDGKDAGFLVLRELLEGKLAGVDLNKVRVVFVPVFNVDGHERFGAHNRPNQIGPEESGWRVTAQNLNLNRDYVKAEAPEMRAMLALLGKEDPVIYMDLHVTDGAEFQHEIAFLVAPGASIADAPAGLAAAAAALREKVRESLAAEKHLPIVDFYPMFMKNDDPSGGFSAMASTPRFSDAYWASRNRLAILVETHSWKDYATRVKATHDAVVAVLGELTLHGEEWRAAEKAAEAEPLAGRPLALGWRPDVSKPKPLEFLGYAYKRSPSAISTVTRIQYDRTKPEVWRVPFYGVLIPTVTATLPRAGWYVPRAFGDLVAAKLAVHGIVSHEVAAPKTMDVEAFRADDIKRRAETFEGRPMVTVRGKWSKESRSFVAGGLFVPVGQPRARLAAQILEPEAPDSLVSWGYFNAVFEQKEYMEDYVLEDVAEKMMQDPAVKAEFERRLKDPAFAKSPHERVDFFYRKHPSWDEQLDLVPIYRVATPL